MKEKENILILNSIPPLLKNISNQLSKLKKGSNSEEISELIERIKDVEKKLLDTLKGHNIFLDNIATLCEQISKITEEINHISEIKILDEKIKNLEKKMLSFS